MTLRRGLTAVAAVLLLAGCGSGEEAPGETPTTTIATTPSSESSTSTSPNVDLSEAPAIPADETAASASPVEKAADLYITGCQMGLGPVETYWSDGTVTGYSARCQAVKDATLEEEVAANNPECDGVVCRYPSGAEMPDPNAPPVVDVPYTCNYDVLCDAAGNVIPGPGGPENGVLLGNGQTCAGNGCTRPR